MTDWVFDIVILIISAVSGLIIAKYAEDELKKGKKWFVLMTVMGVLLGTLFVLSGDESEYLTFFAVVIIAGISWYKARFK